MAWRACWSTRSARSSKSTRHNLEPAPLSVTDRIRDVVGGVYKLHGMLLLELDVERALTI